MKNRILTSLIFIFFTVAVFAEDKNTTTLVTVKGQAVDSITKETIPYATIRVVNKDKPSTVMKVLATDDNGKFQFTMNEQGDYLLTIHYTGKKPYPIGLVVGYEKVVDLGKIMISEDSNLLSELVVVADKPLIKVDLDKITYSMDNDPESKTNNVLDMLRKVPMITVDGEENIQLKGSSNYKIYVNGKPSNMISNNPKDVLKSMPANTIKDIEVITDPGARYDAEGVAGIINIITQTNSSMGGYTATVNAGADSRGIYNGGLYLMLKQGKLGFTGNYNYYRHAMPESTFSSERRTFATENDRQFVNNYLYQDGVNRYRGMGQYGYGELSFELDTLNLINISFNKYGGNNTSTSNIVLQSDDRFNVMEYKYRNEGEGLNTYGSTDINADYQRTFSTKERLLTASYRLSLSPNGSENENIINVLAGIPPDKIVAEHTNQFTDAKSKEHTYQIDFTTPFSKLHTLEVGAKYIVRLNKSNSGYEKVDSLGNWVHNPTLDDKINEFEHRNDIFAMYTGYAFKKNKWGVKAGLRYEYTKLAVKYPLDLSYNFGANYSDIVPSTTITYQLKPSQNIRLGYNMRVYRPSIYQLNPYINNSNPSFISSGNPNLDDVQYHSLNANYGFYTPKLNVNANLSYSFANNSIERYTYVENEVSITTFENIGQTKNLNLSAYINWSASTKLRLYTNLASTYVSIKANDARGLTNSGFTGSTSGGGQYTLPWKLMLNANGGVYFPNINLLGNSNLFYYYSLSVRKSFLSDKLNVTLSTQNPFTKHNVYKATEETSTYSLESIYRRPFRSIGISISYRFGELKSQLKKAKRGIVSEDASPSSGGQQGGGGGGQPN